MKTEKTEREKVIEKIQNLLALSNSPFEEEAKVALNKAHELLVRYNMTLAEVQEMSWTEKIIKETLFDGSRTRGYNKWRTQLVVILGKYFLVVPVKNTFYTENYRRAARLEVRGRETNVAMFKYALNYLIGTYESLTKDFVKATREKYPEIGRKQLRNMKNSYCFGLNISFANSLKAQQKIEEEKGLVATSGVDTSDLKPGREQRGRVMDVGAYANGLNDGKKIQLRAPIETQRKETDRPLQLGN